MTAWDRGDVGVPAVCRGWGVRSKEGSRVGLTCVVVTAARVSGGGAGWGGDVSRVRQGKEGWG